MIWTFGGTGYGWHVGFSIGRGKRFGFVLFKGMRKFFIGVYEVDPWGARW